jgi:hypothetical protein
MRRYPAPRALKSGRGSPAAPYDVMSPGLISGVVLLPIPVILLVLRGNYAPRVKLCWAIAAALDTLATVLLLMATWYQLKDALARI